MNSLYVPTQIKIKAEYFPGFGSKELTITCIATCIAIALAYLCHVFTGALLIPLFSVFGVIAFTISLVVKGSLNVSIVDQFNYLVKFRKSQKSYKYIYHYHI